MMLNPAHPSWMLCVGWADMTNPHSLWVWDTDPPPKVWHPTFPCAPCLTLAFCLQDGEESKDEDDVQKPNFPHKDQKPRQFLRGHRQMVSGLTRLDKGQVISYSEDSTFRLWSGKSLTPKLTYTEHEGYVTGVIQLKQPGEYCGCLASCGWDKTVRLWPDPKFHT